ncbi:hypothetical protein EN828_25265 [Mesorhizobium sp. M2D.F.Ca.ET.185.01.1.1]|uniref:hypothetical protein n=1 Tax=unclassified Mesorhizobium TaxID=325217 RepID=UPI000FCBD80F|nr:MULTISPECIES: hypothetical protein [unclassified Mesorhizobium]TGP74362.1 hypothetical protein EN870_27085 [bacterium M00.F.Ca.ET.227.01.1.1]TGP85048.1 hypothetical protein EN864_27190 [bacterium M00.F.Ca.ET.221.01.1.1]TGP89131.1 hypothetical protein EN865_25615 [bacterium M00.F.Ca.ET.222.01.1.1]TGU12811.1 hypothetical protein EN806_15650 [bacterium M00.F.Ca.ET.163.01.1.1]TGU21286.1 hypothetical protein EN799_53950 [bacterium M00.F.Ca.ET.156.01.1.1]TGU43683.1 hypothetical protein EN789_262
MNRKEMENVKNLLKTASMSIAQLASSLDHYVQDDDDPASKKLFEDQVREAEKLSGDIDDIILKLALGTNPF